MIKLLDLLVEASFRTFEGMVQVVYKDDINSNEVADLFRALPGVTTVTIAGQNAANSSLNLKVKLISQKDGLEAFNSMKTNATDKYPMILLVKVGENTIEEK